MFRNSNRAAVVAVAGLLAFLALTPPRAHAFQTPHPPRRRRTAPIVQSHPGASPNGGGAAVAPAPTGFIDGELRGAAMRLHTKAQAPKEGQAPEKKDSVSSGRMPTTLEDYAQFLADSREVYAAFEAAVARLDDLAALRATGLERTDALAADLDYLVEERGLEARPDPGPAGTEYAAEVRRLADAGATPELVCHYYNHYFAHSAGGRTIGKQMSGLLLDGHVLRFHRWPAEDGGGDTDRKPEHLLGPVRDEIERMAAAWSDEERGRCVGETAATFKYGGSLNRILLGKEGPH